MATRQPVTELDGRFSSDDATAVPWQDAVKVIETAELFWITTVRPDGRPHVTPLIAVWSDGALYVTTGPGEQKARNLARNAQCAITTGCNSLNVNGLDLVIEGDAVRVTDEATLLRIAAAYVSKYGEDWRFRVHDGAFHHEGGEAWVYKVAPSTAFGFGKGETFSQTAWRFQGDT